MYTVRNFGCPHIFENLYFICSLYQSEIEPVFAIFETFTIDILSFANLIALIRS